MFQVHVPDGLKITSFTKLKYINTLGSIILLDMFLNAKNTLLRMVRIPWYISIVQARLKVGLWCSMHHIAHTSGNEIGVQFAYLLLFVVLEVGAAVNELASHLTFAQCFNLL